MALIKYNNIIYGSSSASDISYKNTNVADKLDAAVDFDKEDNSNIVFNENEYLTYGNIVDDLVHDDIDKALSAKQGKVLNDKINAIDITNLTSSIETLSNSIANNANDIITNSTAISMNATNISTLTAWKKGLYPVGSVYVTSTNKNPSSWLGGTWSLYDKQFKTQRVTATVTASKADSISVYAFLSGHRIDFYIKYTTKTTALTDTSVELFTISPKSVGATQFGNIAKSFSHFSDGQNAVIAYTLSTAGLVTCIDVIKRGSSEANVATGASITNCNSMYANLHSIDYMIDSFCDKFFWKRTA
jgi:hypothetical protein